tara:strand:- start:1640 stop:2566 length:927 start_codon:yes stop_codon:yes gene_type:complete
MDAPPFDPFSNKPDISASTRKLYIHNLSKLNKGKPIKNLNFLSPPSILEGLNDIKANTRRTYIIAIVSALKGRPEAKYKKLYIRYYDELMKLNAELKTNTTKSDKQKENWMSQDEIQEKSDDLCQIIPAIEGKKKISGAEYTKLLHCLILSLYVKQAPRRNKDYTDMMVVKQLPSDTTVNYLDINDWKWTFNNYKTKGTYNSVTIPVPPKIQEIIKVYLKYSPCAKELKKKKPLPCPFLIHADGRVINTSTEMTRVLNKILGGKVGSSMLRNIFLTDKYGEVNKEMSEDVAAMGTSLDTANNVYIKKE